MIGAQLKPWPSHWMSWSNHQSLFHSSQAGNPRSSSWASAPEMLTMIDLDLDSTRRPPPVGTVNPPKPCNTIAER